MQTLVWAFSEDLGAAYLDLRDTCVDWIEVIVLMYDWMSFWKVGGWPRLSNLLALVIRGCPVLRVLCEGRVLRRLAVTVLCCPIQRPDGAGSIVPALAKSARTGHPQSWTERKNTERVGHPPASVGMESK